MTPIETRAGSPVTVLDTIGRTPLLRLRVLRGDNPGVEIYAKAEFLNPGGSVKDRAAVAIVREAQASGRLRPGSTILDATSGNTGIAYAMISAACGYQLRLCVPGNVTVERLGRGLERSASRRHDKNGGKYAFRKLAAAISLTVIGIPACTVFQR